MNDTYRHLEDLRHQYKQRYGKVLDDDVLVIISEFKRELNAVERVTFRKGSDYFWFGVGRNFWLLLLVVALLIGFMYVQFEGNKSAVVQVVNTDTIPKKKTKH